MSYLRTPMIIYIDLPKIIEFDRDNELFAPSGIFRRIEIFEFSSVLDEQAQVYCVVVDTATNV
ncbi:hypothetical protein RND81_04G112600 [Saponaria officinalis]|uniref:Uncharacterized protein n=1 Tax=Saponaria officinalis TaxID=3572 RepID=A0AAW1LKI9_SAPOF